MGYGAGVDIYFITEVPIEHTGINDFLTVAELCFRNICAYGEFNLLVVLHDLKSWARVDIPRLSIDVGAGSGGGIEANFSRALYRVILGAFSSFIMFIDIIFCNEIVKRFIGNLENPLYLQSLQSVSNTPILHPA